jgi:hypothetical protein
MAYQQHRSANGSPNPSMYKPQSDLTGGQRVGYSFQQPPLPPSSNYFMDNLSMQGQSQQQQQQMQQRLFQSQQQQQFSNSSYNEVLYNSRGELVGYGMPPNHGMGSQQHHLSLNELNMQSSPYSNHLNNLNGVGSLNGVGYGGYDQRSIGNGALNGSVPTTGPPPGYFEEDRLRNASIGYNNNNNNGGGGGINNVQVPSVVNNVQQQQPPQVQQPQTQQRVNTSEDEIKRLENRTDYAARVQLQMLQQQQQQNRNGNSVNTAAGAGAMKKKGWNNVINSGGGSNYESTIEFNRQAQSSSSVRSSSTNNGGKSGPSNSVNHKNGSSSSSSSSNNNNAQTVAALLDEIRSSSNSNSNMKNGGNSSGGNNSRNWDVNKLKGNIVLFCKDQHGSRFIQQKLETAKEDDKKLIFHEVFPQAKELMTDVFGNYVIQKLFEFGDDAQREALLSLLLGNAIELSMQMYGCRVVQKAFEVLPPPLLVPFVKEFSGDVLECVHDQNGNHVIQKCIEIMSASTSAQGESMSDHIQFIIDAFLGQVKVLASHPYGCRVVQRVLEHCCNSQKHAVLNELLEGGVDKLVKDQYGNYVVQHIIQYGRPADRAVVVMLIRSDLFRFAQHKFASNVVEKCVQFGGQSHRSAMIDEMIAGGGPNSTLMVMIKDQYANYVIQKVIDLSDGDQLSIIANQIRENLNLVRKSTYGKHIITRLEKATGLRIDNNRSF